MIEFVQVLECTLSVDEHRAHERMDATVKSKKGLLGVDRGGKLWSYNYKTLSWDKFSTYMGNLV